MELQILEICFRENDDLFFPFRDHHYMKKNFVDIQKYLFWRKPMVQGDKIFPKLGIVYEKRATFWFSPSLGIFAHLQPAIRDLI